MSDYLIDQIKDAEKPVIRNRGKDELLLHFLTRVKDAIYKEGPSNFLNELSFEFMNRANSAANDDELNSIVQQYVRIEDVHEWLIDSVDDAVKPEVEWTSVNGNVFSVIGTARRALERSALSNKRDLAKEYMDRVKAIQKDEKLGGYNKILYLSAFVYTKDLEIEEEDAYWDEEEDEDWGDEE